LLSDHTTFCKRLKPARREEDVNLHAETVWAPTQRSLPDFPFDFSDCSSSGGCTLESYHPHAVKLGTDHQERVTLGGPQAYP
jgi:hypothetical protein